MKLRHFFGSDCRQIGRTLGLPSNAGADLYIIPGIDMVNHSTDPSLRNTSLHKRELPTASTEPADGGNENGGTTTSFFTLEAGNIPTPMIFSSFRLAMDLYLLQLFCVKSL